MCNIRAGTHKLVRNRCNHNIQWMISKATFNVVVELVTKNVGFY